VGIDYGKSVDVKKIKGIKKSISFMVAEIKKGGDIKDIIKTYAGIELTDDEVRMIR